MEKARARVMGATRAETTTTIIHDVEFNQVIRALSQDIRDIPGANVGRTDTTKTPIKETTTSEAVATIITTTDCLA